MIGSAPAATVRATRVLRAGRRSLISRAAPAKAGAAHFALGGDESSGRLGRPAGARIGALGLVLAAGSAFAGATVNCDDENNPLIRFGLR